MTPVSPAATAYLKRYNPFVLQRFDGLWQRLSLRVSARDPYAMSTGGSEYYWGMILLITFLLCLAEIIGLMALALVLEAATGSALSPSVRHSMLVILLALPALWLAAAGFVFFWTNRFLPATPKEIGEMSASLEARVVWVGIVADWATRRPLLRKDYLRFRRAVKMDKAENARRQVIRQSIIDRSEADDRLAMGAVGAEMERRRLDRITPPFASDIPMVKRL